MEDKIVAGDKVTAKAKGNKLHGVPGRVLEIAGADAKVCFDVPIGKHRCKHVTVKMLLNELSPMT